MINILSMTINPNQKKFFYMPKEHLCAWGAWNSKILFYCSPLPLVNKLFFQNIEFEDVKIVRLSWRFQCKVQLKKKNSSWVISQMYINFAFQSEHPTKFTFLPLCLGPVNIFLNRFFALKSGTQVSCEPYIRYNFFYLLRLPEIF